MATETQLPANDPDLKLAQALGKVLEQRRSFSELDDVLIPALVEYKNKELSELDLSFAPAGLWQRIEAQTKPVQRARVVPLFSQKTIAWASAAVIVLAAFIGIFWLTSQPELELVASSDSAIEYITLDDGTEVTLRPNTELYVDRKSKKSTKKRDYYLDGEAFFDVVSNPDAPFSVATESGTVTVLGTRFNLSTWGTKTAVYLEEGRVRFTGLTSQESVILEPGQSSEIVAGQLITPEQANASTFTDWMNNTIVFSGTSPQEVVAELDQHFGIRIDIRQLADTSGIDGTLRLDSVSQTLSDLGVVLGGTFRQISENDYEFTQID